MKIFSSTIRNLWTTWELPVLVLGSLLLQVALIPMGYKRKYSSNVWLRWLLWLAYLSADSVATVSLGILSNYDDGSTCDGHSPEPEPRFVMRAFWAPFLLLHLGGPDTITAYSMQDNDLWLRHLLGLFIQAGLSFYVFLRALQPTALNFITIPVFVAGIVKYGERTWVLRSSSTEHLREQLIPRSIPGRSIFPKLQSRDFRDLEILHVAHAFFHRNKWVFADLVLSIQDLKETLCCFEEYSCKTAFKVVELELGFMHDFFYTKASLIHSHFGALLRLTTFSATVAAIASFCTINTHRYPLADVYLVFLLLFGALGLEIYSVVLLLCSDWCVVLLTKTDTFLARFIYEGIVCRVGRWSIEKIRWSNSVPQYNLITYCLQDINGGGFRKFLSTSYITKIMDSRPISEELKSRIFDQLKEMVEVEIQDQENKEMADWIVKKQDMYNQLGWSLELDSDQSILLWHIATDLRYLSDHNKDALKSTIEDSKLLSEFLGFLLVSRHSLFPNGMSQMRFNATVKEANGVLEGKSMDAVVSTCTSLLQDWNLKDSEAKDVKENGSSSVFKYGCLLARQLGEMEEGDRWEIISRVWVELLADIASECKVYDHIEQLGHGGDFLTHVWLLMHHLGFNKQAYNVTNAVQESEAQEFHKVVRKCSALQPPLRRIHYLKNYLEGLE